MNIETKKYKNHSFFTIKNNKNLEITFCSFGASVYAIKYKDHYVTYHPENYDEFLSSNKCYGKTLGRVCGRIKDGLLMINNKTYQLDKNEKGNTLHGGFKGLAFCPFTYEFNENDDLINVIFKYNSKDGEGGFPGNVNFVVVYSIAKDRDKFNIHYHAITDKLTPINMSSHIYWRLTGKDILDHELYIAANKNTVVDQFNLLTLGSKNVDRIFDFQRPKLIKRDIYTLAEKQPVAKGYDHGFIFNKKEGEVIILKHKHIKLSVKTDMSAVNVYTNCYPTGGPLKEYGNDVQYGGIAIEPQMYFASYKDILCDKAHPYDRYFSFLLEDY